MRVFLVGRSAVIRVDRLEPRFRVRVQTFAAAAPDLFVGRADVQHAIGVRIAEEEHVADVFRHLPEPQLALRQSLFGCLALGNVTDVASEKLVLSHGPLRQRQVQRKFACVLAPSYQLNGFANDAPLPAGLHPLHAIEMPVPESFRHQ